MAAALLGLNIKAAINGGSSCLGLLKHSVCFTWQSWVFSPRSDFEGPLAQSNTDSIPLNLPPVLTSRYSRNKKVVEATVLDEDENLEKRMTLTQTVGSLS